MGEVAGAIAQPASARHPSMSSEPPSVGPGHPAWFLCKSSECSLAAEWSP